MYVSFFFNITHHNHLNVEIIYEVKKFQFHSVLK